jgi:hypothetical protein
MPGLPAVPPPHATPALYRCSASPIGGFGYARRDPRSGRHRQLRVSAPMFPLRLRESRPESDIVFVLTFGMAMSIPHGAGPGVRRRRASGKVVHGNDNGVVAPDSRAFASMNRRCPDPEGDPVHIEATPSGCAARRRRRAPRKSLPCLVAVSRSD